MIEVRAARGEERGDETVEHPSQLGVVTCEVGEVRHRSNIQDPINHGYREQEHPPGVCTFREST